MELTKLEQQIYTEEELLKELGLNKKQLDYLRWNKGFPYIELQRRVRVYLADEVFEFIKSQAEEQHYQKRQHNKSK